MTNIVYLSQDAGAKIGNRSPDKNEEGRIPELLRDADDCIIRIAGLRDIANKALNTSRTILDNLDNTIAAMPDPDERSMLEDKRTEAREIVLINSSIIFQALEFLAASARTIRAQSQEMVGYKADPRETTRSNLRSEFRKPFFWGHNKLNEREPDCS